MREYGLFKFTAIKLCWIWWKHYFIGSENLGQTAANLLVYRVNTVILYLFGLQEFIESK